MLNSEEHATCHVADKPDDFHFEKCCEDCDVRRISRLTLDSLGRQYQQGRITQDQFEAYMYVWALLSPHGGQPQWRVTPELPDVRRIARKLLRRKGFEIPTELAA